MRRPFDSEKALRRERQAHGTTGLYYIRAYYRVPAMRMGRVRYEGQLGTITGSTVVHLIVRPDERSYKGTRWIVHPTWHVEYLAPDGAVTWADKRLAAWKGQSA